MIAAWFWAGLPALASTAYWLLAAFAALRSLQSRRDRNGAAWGLPPVSILKPMYGSGPHLYEALRSHALQDYPEFEILFGVSNPCDPALKDIARLSSEFPSLSQRVISVKTDAPNPKAFVLSQLAEHARFPLLLINDDDILVEARYLRSVVEPLNHTKLGLVTCLYRATADSWPARLEALGIATEFAPSVLVARLLGVVEFALGATMALHADTLRHIGGFEPIAAYLADDYQLGRRVVEGGGRVEFASAIVETSLGASSWRDVWRHQLRWARTIRVSRLGGYYGSLITNATLWGLIAFAAGQWRAGAAALIVRLVIGWLTGARILKDRNVTLWFWLMPFRDLFGLAVWLAGCFGSTVYWRGRKLRLAGDGRIRVSL